MPAGPTSSLNKGTGVCVEGQHVLHPETKTLRVTLWMARLFLTPYDFLILSPILCFIVGAGSRQSGVPRRNAILPLFAQHAVCFPYRTITSRKPVLSNFTEGYCASLIPPLIILKPVKL